MIYGDGRFEFFFSVVSSFSSISSISSVSVMGGGNFASSFLRFSFISSSSKYSLVPGSTSGNTSSIRFRLHPDSNSVMLTTVIVSIIFLMVVFISIPFQADIIYYRRKLIT